MRGPRLGRGGRPLRIGYGRFFHEACAFSPLPTTRDDFERMHHLEGADLAATTNLRGAELARFMPHAELTGFVQAARLAGQVETVPLTSSLAVPGGPMSLVTFRSILDGLVESVRRAGPLDGIYLALHGSMQVEGLNGEAPEAVILREVMAAGGGARMAVSYDLHGNLSAGMIEPVDVMIAYRSNPHWDLAPTGFRAGNRLIRTLRGELSPVHAWRKLPLVLGGGVTIDFLAPMRGVFRFMKGLERDPRVISASLFMVHPFTDADDLGWATHVSTDGDRDLAARLADELADRAWATRNEELPPMRGIREALDEVASGLWRRLGPVVLVDVDDIVGAGAPGGNTHFAEALAEDDRGLVAYVPVHDPLLVAELWDAPLGSRRRVTLRGTPGYAQPEVPLDAALVTRATIQGTRAIRLDVGSLKLAITDQPPLPIHPSFWTELGLSARKADVIVQKNFFHYRMFYATTALRHLPVVSDGATSLRRLVNRDYPVPMHPKDPVSGWRDSDLVLRQRAWRAPA